MLRELVPAGPPAELPPASVLSAWDEASAAALNMILYEGALFNRRIWPLSEAVGRRTLLVRLIAVVSDESEPLLRREHAANAAYWVRCWTPPVLRAIPAEARAAGIYSAVGYREYYRWRHESFRLAERDVVDDLWPAFWLACLRLFVSCGSASVRKGIHVAFPLDAACYPDSAGELVAVAERIAQADPEAFGRLLNGSTGFGQKI